MKDEFHASELMAQADFLTRFKLDTAKEGR